ncbi:MAG: DEAD/DEAH box helicase [Bacteroidetes bacterium]|nr:MAG: DEAD/DEAH box helicase [Bacteroidota bacterium]
MKVSLNQPFQIVYAVWNHEFLGYLITPYVVQKNSNGELMTAYQQISESNLQAFKSGLDEIDLKLIKILDTIQHEQVGKSIIHTYLKTAKKLNPDEAFLRFYDKDKGNKLFQETLEGLVEGKKSDVLHHIKEHKKYFFISSRDGHPCGTRISFAEEEATARFRFQRHEKGTSYYPTFYYKGKLLNLMAHDSHLICKRPAWLIVDSMLFTFQENIDGSKIKPFLKKDKIDIERQMETTYFTKFVVPLMRQFEEVEVDGEGLNVDELNYQLEPILMLKDHHEQTSKLFEPLPQNAQVMVELQFKYGDNYYKTEDANTNFPIDVKLEIKENNEGFTFKKTKRNLKEESSYIKWLNDMKLSLYNGKVVRNKMDMLAWINDHEPKLKSKKIAIESRLTDNTRYFLGKPEIQISVQEKQDWFDIKALIRFGEYSIAFAELRKYILKKKREFTLPNGEMAIIPEIWFTQFTELFSFSQEGEDGEVRMRKYHFNMLNELRNGDHAQVIMNRKLEALRDFTDIEQYDLPKNFKGELRPYQKAGYDWLRFLQQYSFGGCLADDMGLGKTVITLCLLQAQRESNDPDSKRASLLIMPTTLLYNWQLEAKKFTPKLNMLEYRGSNRRKNIEAFDFYDVIVMSYGVVRQDIELLKKYNFNYIILDEAQAIKNPTSGVAQAVHELWGRHRLTITGTPIENSTLDLWSQMAFVNPGLLGTMDYFRDEFQYPIERNQDADKLKKLGQIIKPFMLRRLKSQVAQDLPEKIENIDYCEMTADQEREYERMKSQYRNEIIRYMETGDTARSNMFILEGLTKLRQIANHPKMIDENYKGDSGKLSNVCHRLESIVAEGSKVLIFSQFVKHLEIIRDYVRDKKWKYAYLTGETHERQRQVEKFQTKENVQIFLISLRAGGVGLNLTAAEYVFMLDPWWNPAIEAQAVDRAHRIGQKNTVFIYKFITRHSVEEKILALQGRKKQLAEDLITADENFVKSLSQDDLLQLLE